MQFKFVFVTKLRNQVLKYFFLSWVQYDLRRYMVMLEKFTLKQNVDKTMNSEKIRSSPYVELYYTAYNYITYIVSRIYSESSDTMPLGQSIEEEANNIVSRFIHAYKKGLEKDLTGNFMPRYPVRFSEFSGFIHETVSNFKGQEIRDKLLELSSKVDSVTLLRDRRFCRPSIKHYAMAIWYMVYQAVTDTRNMAKELNITFSGDGEERCLFNMFNLYLHFMALERRLWLTYKERRIIFAAAAIHPVHDDMVDNGKLSKEDLGFITDKLLGRIETSPKIEVNPVFSLIEWIYKAYPVKEHPMLVQILTQLNYWQEKSSIQQNGHCNKDDLLQISFMKGGYAFAFYGYIVLGKLSLMQFRHFFGMGAVFQILDDFHDINDDLKSQTSTVWTDYISKGLCADPVMNGILAVQEEYERITPVIRDFKNPVFVRRIEMIGARFDILRFYFMHYEYFSEAVKTKIQECLPVDIDFIFRYKQKASKINTTHDYLQVLLFLRKLFLR